MADDYDPVESLRREVKRFKSTNRFNPMEVTNFYVQADLVLSELDQLRRENKSLRDDQALLTRFLSPKIGE